MTALLLLAPGTPMLFQGQEFASSSPFLFFADHQGGLADRVRQGRVEFLKQWRSLRLPDMQTCFAEPSSEHTFLRSKIDHSERHKNHEIYALHCDLLKLRREDPVFRSQRARSLDGAVLGAEAFVLRFFGESQDDRLLLVNFGTDLELSPMPEPLLAAPESKRWRNLLSTEDPPYGGCGNPPLDREGSWLLPGHAAVALGPAEPPPSHRRLKKGEL